MRRDLKSLLFGLTTERMLQLASELKRKSDCSLLTGPKIVILHLNPECNLALSHIFRGLGNVNAMLLCSVSPLIRSLGNWCRDKLISVSTSAAKIEFKMWNQLRVAGEGGNILNVFYGHNSSEV